MRWRDRSGRVIDDYSAVWDHGSVGVSHRDEETILGVYQTRLEELAGSADIDAVEALLEPLAGRDVPAVIWRRILDVTSRYPRVLGPILADAVASAAILGDTNINLAAQPALAACFEFLTEQQREAIEHTILSLPADEEFPRRRRNALLLALPEQLISSDAGREQRAEALTERGQPEEPPWPSDFLEDAPIHLDRDQSETGTGSLLGEITPTAATTQPPDSTASRGVGGCSALEGRCRSPPARPRRSCRAGSRPRPKTRRER